MTGYREGPANRVDLQIERGYSASEIAAALDVPRWFAVERFQAASRHAAPGRATSDASCSLSPACGTAMS